MARSETSLAGRFRICVASFGASPHEAVRQLRTMLSEDPERFLEAATPLLAGDEEPEARRFVAMLVARNELFLPLLANPEILTVEAAVTVARRIMPFEPALERKLVRALQAESGAVCSRLLDIVAGITPAERVEAVLSPLAQHADVDIRAAVIPVLTRQTGSLDWALDYVTQADPRIRASAIRALWGARSDPVVAVVRRAEADPHALVASAALVALYKLGDSASVAKLDRMAAHEDPAFRVAAGHAMALTGDARFVPSLKRLLQDRVTGVRSQAIRSLASLKRAHARPGNAQTLAVRVLRTSVDHGEATIWTQVSKATGERIPALSPVQFAVWNGSQPVLDYRMAETGGPGPLAVGFGLWRTAAMSNTLWRAAEQGVDTCLDLKSPLHAWSVISVPEPRKDSAQPDPMLDIALALIETASHSAETRHVILLAHPDSTHPDHVGRILEAAARRAVTLHIIAPAPAGDDHPLRALALLPGGTFRVAAGPEELTAAYQDVYRSLLVCYAISFPAQKAGTRPDFQLEVNCEHGRAREAFRLEPDAGSYFGETTGTT